MHCYSAARWRWEHVPMHRLDIIDSHTAGEPTRVVLGGFPDLGGGSRDAHSVMATATSYLPEALEAYLRLPRSFADRRPVDGNKTSLMVLVDQLDLLAVTMEKIRDAVYRADAEALVAHGRFLAEKFGHSADGGQLNMGGT